MRTQIVLEPLRGQTRFAPLGVLGYCLTRTGFLQPVWSQVHCGMKTYQHQPTEKLQDMLTSILAGNQSLAQINTRIRPDRPLAAAWDRACFAEQSSVARTLDGLTEEQVEQLQQGSQALFRQHARTMQHNFEQHWLVIDIDPTHLPAARSAPGSHTHYVNGKKNQSGRWWNRISVPTYHETLFSQLYPGNWQACQMLKPDLLRIQEFLKLSLAQRKRTIVRSDASLGTDGNINHLLWADYQVLMKGFSGSRAAKLGKQVADEDWLEDPVRKRWIAWAPDPPRFARRTQVFSLRWRNRSTWRYGTLVSSLLDLEPAAALRLHDGRGAVEVEIKADKQGLKASHRRKKSFEAQAGLILLTDLAHNLLSWTHHWSLEGSPFEDFGTQRMVEELLCIPGRIVLKGPHLHKVALLQSHPYAADMRFVLVKLLDFFGNP